MRGLDYEMGNGVRQGMMLVAFLAACFAAATIGGQFTSSSVTTWYPTLHKPSWNPPAWVFGPVWTTLYAMMAVAAWLVWKRRGFAGGKLPLTLFAVQLILNAAWSYCFFDLRSPLAGFIEIVFLWIAIVATMVSFWSVAPTAGWLLFPYLIWVSFAVALNFTLWRMNP